LKNREEILSLLFSVLTLMAFMQFLKKSKYVYLFAAFFAFCLAVFAKISAIPFVLLIALFCVYMNEKWWDKKYLPIGVVTVLPIIFYFVYMATVLPGQGRMPGVSSEGVQFQERNVYSYSENPLDVDGTIYQNGWVLLARFWRGILSRVFFLPNSLLITVTIRFQFRRLRDQVLYFHCCFTWL